jgi:hypothetical protein
VPAHGERHSQLSLLRVCLWPHHLLRHERRPLPAEEHLPDAQRGRAQLYAQQSADAEGAERGAGGGGRGGRGENEEEEPQGKETEAQEGETAAGNVFQQDIRYVDINLGEKTFRQVMPKWNYIDMNVIMEIISNAFNFSFQASSCLQPMPTRAGIQTEAAETTFESTRTTTTTTTTTNRYTFRERTPPEKKELKIEER